MIAAGRKETNPAMFSASRTFWIFNTWGIRLHSELPSLCQHTWNIEGMKTICTVSKMHFVLFQLSEKIVLSLCTVDTSQITRLCFIFEWETGHEALHLLSKPSSIDFFSLHMNECLCRILYEEYRDSCGSTAEYGAHPLYPSDDLHPAETSLMPLRSSLVSSVTNFACSWIPDN